MTSDKRAQKSRTDETSLSRSGYSASGLRAAWKISFNQSEALTRYGNMEFPAPVSQTSFGGKTSGGVAKYQLFSQAGFCSVFLKCE